MFVLPISIFKIDLACVLIHHPSFISSVAQSCLTLCEPMDCSTPGFPVKLPEPTQTSFIQNIKSQLVSELLMECSLPALCSHRAKPRPRTGNVGSNPAFLSAVYLHHHLELQVVLASSSAPEAEDCTLLATAGLRQTCRMWVVPRKQCFRPRAGRRLIFL